jgi:hypothetical protein
LDGRFIIFVTMHPETKLDLWMLSLDDRKAVPYLRTAYNELQGQVSPDGRWIAYTSDESGSWEVYVQSFPIPGNKQRISTRGGAQPKWRRDGRELFYLSADLTLMAAAIRQGDRLEPGVPVSLFRAQPPVDLTSNRNAYTVTSDGQRFLVSTLDRDIKSSPVVVVLNWTTALPH